MYTSYYKFKSDPFRLTPGLSFRYMHRGYVRARAYMEYHLYKGDGIAMMTGAPGLGKTTLIQDLTLRLSARKTFVMTLVSSRLAADDFLRMVAFSLRLPAEELNKATLLKQIEINLMKRHKEGYRCILIVDEAQELFPSAFKELRLLTNLQTESNPLIQIMLVGQRELRSIVRSSTMSQLHQRFVATHDLAPLDELDTREYVRHRLARSGWQGDPGITADAIRGLYRFSRGIPRTINLITSRLLQFGALERKHLLDGYDVDFVAQQLTREMLNPEGVVAR